MKIKEFELDLELQENGELFKITDKKEFELKILDSLNQENDAYTADFKDMEELFTKDPDRGRILSYLLMRGWENVYKNSPIFNYAKAAEVVRNELLNKEF